MTNRAEQLREDARLRALRLIDSNPKITQRELSHQLGLSLGATHYMVRALVDRGLVKIARFRATDSKRGYVYVLTPSGLAEKAAIAGRFLLRKREEYEALREEIASLGHEIEASDASDPNENK